MKMTDIRKMTLEMAVKIYMEHRTIPIIKDGKLKGFTKESK